MKPENTSNPPYILFYSYSHKDEELKELLDKHLIMLKRSGLIQEWHDRKILPGDKWDKQISKYLEAARIILLLISSDFLASEYCYDIEAKRALERYNNGDAYLIPVILRPVFWELSPFKDIQALPKNARPVKEWGDLDLAFVNVCEGILAVIMSIKSEQESNHNIKPTRFASGSPQTESHVSRRRVLDAALPASVAVERTVTLVVMIRRPDSEGLRKILKVNDNYGVSEKDVESTDAFPLEFPLDADGDPQPLDLAIKIESPDFEPKTQTKSIRVLPRGDTDPRIFLLTPKREGNLFVNVELYKDARLLSGCLLDTKALETESETPSVNLVSVPLESESEAILSFPLPNKSLDYSALPSPQPHIFSQNIDISSDSAPNGNYFERKSSSKAKRILFGTVAATLALIFPVIIGTILLSFSSSEVASNTNNSHANYNSNHFIVVSNSNHSSSNISRADYDKNRAQYEANRGTSTIGRGANDSWLWFKTKSALSANKDLHDSTIRVDVANDVITLKGTVATAAHKTAAETVAKGIEGQKGVKNELKVHAGEAPTNLKNAGKKALKLKSNANKKN